MRTARNLNMLYNVYGNHETSPKTFIQLEADSPADAENEARERGWTVERVERADHRRRVATAAPSDDGVPEYEGLWMMGLLLRVFGVAIAAAAAYAMFNDALPDLGVPNYIVMILLLLIAFEVYVSGEAVAAFRHLVQNSWAWRRTQK
jgi:hypothetical protein